MRLCPWSLALAPSFPVLGLERVCPRKGCPWSPIFFVALTLASSLVSSTPPLGRKQTSTVKLGKWSTPKRVKIARMRLSHFCFNFLNLKIFGKIIITKKRIMLLICTFVINSAVSCNHNHLTVKECCKKVNFAFTCIKKAEKK